MEFVFTKTCIKCGTTENLNSKITVKVDDKSYEVAICDEHSDDATPKMITGMVREKIASLSGLMSELSKYTVSDGKIAVVREKPQPVQPQLKSVQPQSDQPVVESKQLEQPRSVLPGFKTDGAVVDDVSISGYSSVNIDAEVDGAIKKLKDKGEKDIVRPVIKSIQMQQVVGRAGKRINIPKKIDHNTGTSEIRIVKTDGDAMQKNFKEMSRVSLDTGVAPDFGKSYKIKDCSVCRGTGKTRVGDQPCPRCKGKGIIT